MDNKDWISVKDNLPKEDDQVLIYNSKLGNGTRSDIRFGWYYNKCWHIESSDKNLIEYHPDQDEWIITHWMPLPEPPAIPTKNA